MKLSQSTIDDLAAVDRASKRPQGRDTGPLASSPVAFPVIMDALTSQNLSKQGIHKLIEQSHEAICNRLKEFENEPKRYTRARMMAYQILADRWMQLSAMHIDDPKMAEQLLSLATKCENIALKLDKSTEKMPMSYREKRMHYKPDLDMLLR